MEYKMKTYDRKDVKALPYKMILFFAVGDNCILSLECGAEVWKIITESTKKKCFTMKIVHGKMHIWRSKK